MATATFFSIFKFLYLLKDLSIIASLKKKKKKLCHHNHDDDDAAIEWLNVNVNVNTVGKQHRKKREERWWRKKRLNIVCYKKWKRNPYRSLAYNKIVAILLLIHNSRFPKFSTKPHLKIKWSNLSICDWLWKQKWWPSYWRSSSSSQRIFIHNNRIKILKK